MLKIVAQLPAQSTAGLMELLIFLDTVFIFVAQRMRCFPLLVQFPLQETAQKTNSLQGLCALWSNMVR
jgi:hypothetical protein